MATGVPTAWTAASYIRTYLTQVIGNFGWLETPIGEEAFLVAMIVAGFVIMLGLLAADRRQAASTAIALAVLLVAPVMFGVIRFPYLQGRYLLPIWVCLMILAAAASASTVQDRGFTRRATSLVLVTWLTIHVVGFLQNIRRYTVGRNGSWGSIIDSEWSPPMMSIPAVLYLLVVCVAVAFLLIRKLLNELEQADAPSEPTVPLDPTVAPLDASGAADPTDPLERELVWASEWPGSDGERP